MGYKAYWIMINTNKTDYDPKEFRSILTQYFNDFRNHIETTTKINKIRTYFDIHTQGEGKRVHAHSLVEIYFEGENHQNDIYYDFSKNREYLMDELDLASISYHVYPSVERKRIQRLIYIYDENPNKELIFQKLGITEEQIEEYRNEQQGKIEKKKR